MGKLHVEKIGFQGIQIVDELCGVSYCFQRVFARIHSFLLKKRIFEDQ
jgi:hypothetical protein